MSGTVLKNPLSFSCEEAGRSHERHSMKVYEVSIYIVYLLKIQQ